MSEYCRELMRWLDQGCSPYHTVARAADWLRERGFTSLSLGEVFALRRGGRYFVENGTSLCAFTLGDENYFRIAAAHTDWPCMRVKPNPESVAGGCCRLSVEPYGGAILNTWLDRPLSLAGTVLTVGENPMRPVRRLVAWEEPVATIPNVAIHLNREVNKGVALKPNVDLLPLCAAVEEGLSRENYLLHQLAGKLQVKPEEILSFELWVYCGEQARRVGFGEDFLSSPRLDNLTSVHACLHGLAEAQGQGINVVALFDHEEIGSNTRRGGDSVLLPVVLEKITLALGLNRTDYINACVNGMLLSCDAAHAVHPNHPELADRSCAPVLNGGVALKRSPRYSSDAETCAVIQGLCREKQIPLQLYMNRPDLPGGSTVGSMASALLAMPAADVGVPILAMHSARELMGSRDQEAFCRLCTAFFET